MNRRSVRVGTRALALTGATSLLATALLVALPHSAQAETTYDGRATALSVSGLKLTLFPSDAKLPPLFSGLARPDEQVVDLSGQLPSRIGDASFPGIDEPGSLPDNPVLNGGGLVASSARVGDKAVTEAKIGHLDIGGGALTLEDIVARCTADGSKITMSAPLASMDASGFGGAPELKPNTETPIPGVGSITWNDQVTDGKTFGKVLNLVIKLRTNLDADVLQDLPESLAAFEGVLKQLIKELSQAGEKNLGLDLPGVPAGASGQQLYDTLDQIIAKIPTQQLPDLNSLLRLEGKITLASATCSQEGVFTPVDHNPPEDKDNLPPDEKSPPKGGESDDPPLADTGVSPWPIRAGLAGIVAVTVGGFLVLRQRRDTLP